MCQYSAINRDIVNLMASFLQKESANVADIIRYNLLNQEIYQILKSQSFDSITLDEWISITNIFDGLYQFATNNINQIYMLNQINVLPLSADQILLVGSALFDSKRADYQNFTGQYNTDMDDSIAISSATKKVITELNNYLGLLSQFTCSMADAITIEGNMFTASIAAYKVSESTSLLSDSTVFNSKMFSSLPNPLNGPQEFYVGVIDWKSNPFYFLTNSTSVIQLKSVTVYDSNGQEETAENITSSISIIFHKTSSISDLACTFYDESIVQVYTVLVAQTVNLKDISMSEEQFKQAFPDISYDFQGQDFVTTMYTNKTITNANGGFSDAGCSKSQESETDIECRCNHLSDFSLSLPFGMQPNKTHSFYTAYDPIATYKSSLGYIIMYIVVCIYGLTGVIAFVLDMVQYQKYIHTMMKLRGKVCFPTISNLITKNDDAKEAPLHSLNITKQSDLSENSIVKFGNFVDKEDRLSDLNSDKESDIMPAKSAILPKKALEISIPPTPQQHVKHTSQYKQKSGKKITGGESAFIKINAKKSLPLSNIGNANTSINKVKNTIERQIENIIDKDCEYKYYTDYFCRIQEGHLAYIEGSNNSKLVLSNYFTKLRYYNKFLFKSIFFSYCVIANSLKTYSLSISRLSRLLVAYVEMASYFLWTFVLIAASTEKVYIELGSIRLASFNLMYIWAAIVAAPLASLTAFIPSLIFKRAYDYSKYKEYDELAVGLYCVK